jgi:hypothetical protein
MAIRSVATAAAKMPGACSTEGKGARPRGEQIWWCAFVVERGQVRRPRLLRHFANETISDPSVHLSAALVRNSRRFGMAPHICKYASRHTETRGLMARPALVGAHPAQSRKVTPARSEEAHLAIWRRRHAEAIALSAVRRFVIRPVCRRVAWRFGLALLLPALCL